MTDPSPQSAAEEIGNALDRQARVAVILGSGLGGLTDSMEDCAELSYSAISGFPESTVKGHGGKMVRGTLQGVPVLTLAGRFHYYEGYSMDTLAYPVQVLNALGISTLVISNAAGGLKPGMEVGDMMIIRDHIYLQPLNPFVPLSRDPDSRHRDMIGVYDPALRATAMRMAKDKGYRCHEGVYAGVQGPTFETLAEYAMFHRFGADAVGMSTVPEALVAHQFGMQLFGISVIADIGYPSEQVETISHDLVIDAAAKAAPKMIDLVSSLIASLRL